MSTTEMAGYLAAFLVFLTFYMKTMIPLRLVGICSNLIFITYAYFGSLHPVLVLHLILLPLNGLRLREMLRLTREVRGATQGDLRMDWLKPFTSVRRFKRGDILFRKGGCRRCYVPRSFRTFSSGRTRKGYFGGADIR